MKKGTKASCECDICKEGCEYKPGWFLPGEAEKVADHLGVSLEELFKTKLGVDWWVGDRNTYLLAPAIVDMDPGKEYPADPRGRCVFYHDGLCDIHPVKPHECRELIHDQEFHDIHEKTAMAWKPHQAQISALLGHEPEETGGFSLFDALDSVKSYRKLAAFLVIPAPESFKIEESDD